MESHPLVVVKRSSGSGTRPSYYCTQHGVLVSHEAACCGFFCPAGGGGLPSFGCRCRRFCSSTRLRSRVGDAAAASSHCDDCFASGGPSTLPFDENRPSAILLCGRVVPRKISLCLCLFYGATRRKVLQPSAGRGGFRATDGASPGLFPLLAFRQEGKASSSPAAWLMSRACGLAGTWESGAKVCAPSVGGRRDDARRLGSELNLDC